MARKCLIEKSKRTPRYKSRVKLRCQLCGRPRAYLRRFQVCRLCFRKLALNGSIPGVRKASW